jgi:dipeptidyl aminopeptidase/acylaminoacyl peptidase
MAKALEAQHVPHELIILPGYGHGFNRVGDGIKDRAVAQAFERVLAFLKSCMIVSGSQSEAPYLHHLP